VTCRRPEQKLHEGVGLVIAAPLPQDRGPVRLARGSERPPASCQLAAVARAARPLTLPPPLPLPPPLTAALALSSVRWRACRGERRAAAAAAAAAAETRPCG